MHDGKKVGGAKVAHTKAEKKETKVSVIYGRRVTALVMALC